MPDTGAPYNIPFADPTDLVRDWPALSEDVALAIVAALENIPVLEKRIARFTGSGTWTVPAGVTYAIAHILGGGGGIGTSGSGGNGGSSSVAFASGTVTATGANKVGYDGTSLEAATAGVANSGRSAGHGSIGGSAARSPGAHAPDAHVIVAGAAVTPAASITVTVGAGGSAGTSGAAGGSGYVYIEYYEEV
jgi:hypothetical protein